MFDFFAFTHGGGYLTWGRKFSMDVKHFNAHMNFDQTS